MLLRWDTRVLINFNYLWKKRHVQKMTILKQLFPTVSSRDLCGKTMRWRPRYIVKGIFLLPCRNLCPNLHVHKMKFPRHHSLEYNHDSRDALRGIFFLSFRNLCIHLHVHFNRWNFQGTIPQSVITVHVMLSGELSFSLTVIYIKSNFQGTFYSHAMDW